MSLKIMATRICDRCSKCIGQEVIQPDFKGKLPDVQPTRFQIVREHLQQEVVEPEKTETLVSFRDLCQSCEGAIHNLVLRILMRESDKPAVDPSTETGSGSGSQAAPQAAAGGRRRKADSKVPIEGLDPKGESAQAAVTATPEASASAAAPAAPPVDPATSSAAVDTSGVDFPPDPGADEGVADPDQPF